MHAFLAETATSLADFAAGSFYSALELIAEGTNDEWSLFQFARSDPMPESGRVAGSVHTNLPRAGYVGLPQDWEHLVVGWHARITDDHQTVQDWVNETSAAFFYRHKRYYEVPFRDLLRNEPIIIKQDLAEIISDPNYLNNGPDLDEETARKAMFDRVGMQVVRIQENLDFHVTLRTENAKALKDLRTYLAASKRTLSLWVYLDGLTKRPIM